MRAGLVGVAALLGMGLGGCSGNMSAGFQNWAHTPVGSPMAGVANFIDGVNNGTIQQQDDKKCRSFGYSPEVSPYYGNCRIELERLRAASAPAVVYVR